ncbi:MAG: helix-turn-helix domain-containing protein [Bryobacteraceae bacterium]
MKSRRGEEPVTFAILQAVLIALLKTRINNGHFTERGLARILGISQPQLHNVMKGKRRLQTELADRILDKFGLSVLDLIEALTFYRHPSGNPNPNIFVTDQLALVSPLTPIQKSRSTKRGPNVDDV